MNEKVSGCIVTYNNEDIIYKCIDSILRYTEGLNFTLYVVDNGSTDKTVGIIRDNFKNVRLICNKKNTGFGHGHNRVLDMIDSEYHVVINPDIMFNMDAITPLIRYLKEHKDVMMITPKILNPDNTEQFLPKYCPSVRHVIISKFGHFRYLRKEYTRENEEFNAPAEIEFATGCFFIIRTAILRQVKGFDNRFFMYCEDADLSRNVRKIGSIIFYPQATVVHEWKRDNTRSLRGIMRFMTSLFKYFLKWGIKF